MKRNALIKMVQFSILLALEVIMCFTPLGSIPIGPMVATLAMIPVILTGILLGVGAGAAMGFFAGLFSFIVWTFISPGPTAFVFTPFVSIGDIHGNGWSLVICFIPRILTGVVAAVSAKGFAKLLHYKFSIFTYKSFRYFSQPYQYVFGIRRYLPIFWAELRICFGNCL